ncbi:DNA adenine methylase [Vibrio sp. 10N.222.54.F12]|uniref:DNA adenine methylase n=1 Tax=Vibrio TaxID=662 RepID=UPI000C85FFF8|nr:DNA adenine methylase [Vibrio tasmaniensis]PML17650.1 DNA methyltransferase [Vibrio tasmaniensis]
MSVKKMHTPLLRYHGGKFRLAKWVMEFFPDHKCYVEPFGGAGSVLLQKERSHGEVYNDLDQDVFNLFQVLRNEEHAKKLTSMCELTPYSRDEFCLAYEKTNDPIERARRTIVRSAMGFGSGAATFHPTGFRCEAKRKYSTSAHCWGKYTPVIEFVCERLRGVNIENRDATKCMLTHDGVETLHYVDPPYMKETRVLNSSRQVYQHEMTDAEHEQLLACLINLKGMVVLSGYDSDLYNDLLPGWFKKEKLSRISAGKGTKLKVECLWVSPSCDEALSKSEVAA